MNLLLLFLAYTPRFEKSEAASELLIRRANVMTVDHTTCFFDTRPARRSLSATKPS
jgi:hypothetical protein